LAAGLWKAECGPVSAEPLERPSLEARVADLERRLNEPEIEAAASKHAAFVFIKPHAVNDKVKYLVDLKLRNSGINIVSEGEIKAETIDEKMLIDTHYGAIAAKAVKLKPSELNVQPQAKEAFQKMFGESWDNVLKSGKVFNALDGAKALGISPSEMGGKFGGQKVKFGGGFYVGKVDDIFVINGFYMDMRSKFTKPGTSIYYYEVEWDPKDLSWADFREKILGGTDPAKAYTDSARHLIYANWKTLGLAGMPNTGDNGVHASASPFEALSERVNWLGVDITKDFFGKGMLASGVPLSMLRDWCDDPQVAFQGGKKSLFDLLEDLDAGECLAKSGKIAEAN